MEAAFDMHNATGGMNQACVAAAGGTPSQCAFAKNTVTHVRAPLFAVNSVVDSWQLSCIFTAARIPANSTKNGMCGYAPGWNPCTAEDTEIGAPLGLCSAAQVGAIAAYARRFLADFRSAGLARRLGSGAFLHSCRSHCAAALGMWQRIAEDGRGRGHDDDLDHDYDRAGAGAVAGAGGSEAEAETVQQAVAQWWAAPDGTYTRDVEPCALRSSKPFQCNPTCPAS